MEQESNPALPPDPAGAPVEPGFASQPSVSPFAAGEDEIAAVEAGPAPVVDPTVDPAWADTSTDPVAAFEDEEYGDEVAAPGLPALPGYGLPAAIAVPDHAGVSASRLALVSAVFAIGTLLYLAVAPEQHWILRLLVGLVPLGVDGIVRGHPRSFFTGDI